MRLLGDPPACNLPSCPTAEIRPRQDWVENGHLPVSPRLAGLAESVMTGKVGLSTEAEAALIRDRTHAKKREKTAWLLSFDRNSCGYCCFTHPAFFRGKSKTPTRQSGPLAN